MLRRKLILHLGPLIVLLLATAVVAIWLMQGVLRELPNINPDRFRWMILGLAVVFVLVINVSVIVLLRMGAMVVRPVEKLLTATRELAGEHFDYRVKLDQPDEFGELASAFNSLAERLQSNEGRKMEVLQQVALAMNHELNNDIAIIEFQLSLLKRQTTGNPTLERYLREIHGSLNRVTQAAKSLKNARRIVLTDYVTGVKMLDLEKSMQDEQEHPNGLIVSSAESA